jgi:hypothetical protein
MIDVGKAERLLHVKIEGVYEANNDAEAPLIVNAATKAQTQHDRLQVTKHSSLSYESLRKQRIHQNAFFLSVTLHIFGGS